MVILGTSSDLIGEDPLRGEDLEGESLVDRGRSNDVLFWEKQIVRRISPVIEQ